MANLVWVSSRVSPEAASFVAFAVNEMDQDEGWLEWDPNDPTVFLNFLQSRGWLLDGSETRPLYLKAKGPDSSKWGAVQKVKAKLVVEEVVVEDPPGPDFPWPIPYDIAIEDSDESKAFSIEFEKVDDNA